MKIIDFKKEFGTLYFPLAREVAIVDVPPMNFAMVDGEGDPNTSRPYREAMEALYGVSYGLKFALKSKGIADYKVGPLEGLWWVEDPSRFSLESREDWKWTSMIMQPAVVTRSHFGEAVRQLVEKRNPAALGKVRFERFDEGPAAQILHVGPYSAEGPTIERLHKFVSDHGYGLRGKHHEIYLGDPRKAAPERLKTVIRQPFSK